MFCIEFVVVLSLDGMGAERLCTICNWEFSNDKKCLCIPRLSIFHLFNSFRMWDNRQTMKRSHTHTLYNRLNGCVGASDRILNRMPRTPRTTTRLLTIMIIINQINSSSWSISISMPVLTPIRTIRNRLWQPMWRSSVISRLRIHAKSMTTFELVLLIFQFWRGN